MPDREAIRPQDVCSGLIEITVQKTRGSEVSVCGALTETKIAHSGTHASARPLRRMLKLGISPSLRAAPSPLPRLCLLGLRVARTLPAHREYSEERGAAMPCSELLTLHLRRVAAAAVSEHQW